jgi:hypothetical protein
MANTDKAFDEMKGIMHGMNALEQVGRTQVTPGRSRSPTHCGST